jgi:hypothetical protein
LTGIILRERRVTSRRRCATATGEARKPAVTAGNGMDRLEFCRNLAREAGGTRTRRSARWRPRSGPPRRHW